MVSCSMSIPLQIGMLSTFLNLPQQVGANNNYEVLIKASYVIVKYSSRRMY